MSEFVPSVNAMVGILVFAVAGYIWYFMKEDSDGTGHRYKSNPLLKQRGVSIDFTKDQVKEIIKAGPRIFPV